MPEVTGEPAAVTLTVAVAAENCVTVAAGEKLIVVDVFGGGPPANTTAEARNTMLGIDVAVFIVEEPFQ